MEGKKVRIGQTEVSLDLIARSFDGLEDRIAEVVEADYGEGRLKLFGAHLRPMAKQADIREWDSILLSRYPPLYVNPGEECADCNRGPCSLGKADGRCGLSFISYQARRSLRAAVRGATGQLEATRRLLDYTLRAFGRSYTVTYGQHSYLADLAPSIGILTGIYVKDLADLDLVLSYAERELVSLMLSGYQGTQAEGLEGMSLHAGCLLALVMEVAELIKTSCFGFATAADQKLEDLINYPPYLGKGGLGSLDLARPVAAFTGDDFLPAWSALSWLKAQRLEGRVQLCGIGPVGHDLLRFYPEALVLAPMTRARQVVKTGLLPVLTITQGCLPDDLVAAAQAAGCRVITTDPDAGLPNGSDLAAEDLVAALISGRPPGFFIPDPEKAGEVAARLAVEVSPGHPIPPPQADWSRCREDCDRCFAACPNGLLIGPAVRDLARGNGEALSRIATGCYLCGRCQVVCPEELPLDDLLVHAQVRDLEKDRIVLRPGRGPVSQVEARQSALPLLWGNYPGYALILGCGDASSQEGIGFLAYELLSRNCVVMTAGCGAGEIGRYLPGREGKPLYQLFGSECQARNLLNCGGCSASVHLVDLTLKIARLIGGISHYANYEDTADFHLLHCEFAIIMWGVLPERMYALASAFARNGQPVVVGPASAYGWPRYLMGNKWDRSRWWVYDGNSGQKRGVEPCPKHLIIPVETPEEALVMALGLEYRYADTRELRACQNEAYIEAHEKHFGCLPDDWPFFVRSDTELPPRHKMRLLKELASKHGWEVEGFRIKRAQHPDRGLMEFSEYAKTYALEPGQYGTLLPRLIVKGKGAG